MFKILGKLRLAEWIYVLLGVLLIVGQVWLDLEMPKYMEKITYVLNAQSGSVNITEIWINGGYMLLCGLGSAIFAMFTGFIAAKIAAGLGKNLRAEVFRKVNNLGIEEIKQFSVPSLITRTTNDVVNMQNFISMGFNVLIKAPILAGWTIVEITNINWQWSTATALAVFTLVLVIITLMIITVPRYRKIQKLTDNLNDVTRENITGIRVVRAYNAEDYQHAKFQTANHNLAHNYLVTGNAMSLMPAMMNLVMNSLTLSIYLIGAWLISRASVGESAILFGQMVKLVPYSMNVVMSFVMMTMIFIMLPRSIVSARRINEVLDTKLSIHDGPGAHSTEHQGEIEFRHVSFKYPGASDYIIRNANLKIERGQTVAFIGSTGSGKTTLVNLVPRFYDATEGEVLIDGINVKDYKQEDLHNKIGYVPQKAMLFSGNIRDNIDFGQDGHGSKTDEQINEAIRIAQAADFVGKVGLDAPVAQGGTNFSGGQKQRLCIARAIARQAEFMIFDDSFSALDYKTDRNLRKEIKKITQKTGSTVLIVAQRIGTIKDADRIVVFDNGNIVGIGTHDELAKNCQVYQEIIKSQFSKEELA